jgi:hypothetical protein
MLISSPELSPRSSDKANWTDPCFNKLFVFGIPNQNQDPKLALSPRALARENPTRFWIDMIKKPSA